LPRSLPAVAALLCLLGCGDSSPPDARPGSTETLRALESIERLLDAGRVSEALRAAEACAKARPNDALSAEMLGRALMAAGAPRADIANAYARAAELRPDSPGLQGVAGITAMQAGRMDVALAHLERAVALEPGNPQHAMQLSLALRSAARWQEATRAAERAIALAPLEASAHLALAESHRGAARNTDAITSARQALACAPADRSIRQAAAACVVSCGDAPLAVEWIAAIATGADATPAEIETFANALRASNRPEHAAAQWERLASAPTHPWRPCLEAAACHSLAGDSARSAEWLSRARERGAPPEEISRLETPGR
jgi:tetratricopeptide (TPR) repeat protein